MSTGVIATVLLNECNFTDGMTGDEIIKEAFSKGKNHWMAHGESQAFDAAVTVAYSKMKDDDKDRMRITLDGIKAIDAMLKGVPIDIERVMEAQEGVELFPLIVMWKETK